MNPNNEFISEQISPEDVFNKILEAANLEVGVKRYTEFHFVNGQMYILPDSMKDGYSFHLSVSHSMYDQMKNKTEEYSMLGYPVDELLPLNLNSDTENKTLCGRGYLIKNEDGSFLFEITDNRINSRKNSSELNVAFQKICKSLRISIQLLGKTIDFNEIFSDEVIPLIVPSGWITNYLETIGDNGTTYSGLVSALKVTSSSSIDKDTIRVEFEGIQGRFQSHTKLITERKKFITDFPENGILKANINGEEFKLTLKHTIDPLNKDQGVKVDLSIIESTSSISRNELLSILSVYLGDIFVINRSLFKTNYHIEISVIENISNIHRLALDSDMIDMDRADNDPQYLYSILSKLYT